MSYQKYASEEYLGVPGVRDYSEAEANQLEESATQSKLLTKSTKKANKAIGKLAKETASRHVSGREMQVVVGKEVLAMAKADEKTLKKLGPLAVNRAKALKEAAEADNNAIQAISQVSGRYYQSPAAGLGAGNPYPNNWS